MNQRIARLAAYAVKLLNEEGMLACKTAKAINEAYRQVALNVDLLLSHL